MATSNPLNIKSAARKLPIKRKNPPLTQPQLIAPIPNPNPNIPTPTPLSSIPLPHNDHDPDYDDDPEFDDDTKQQPPFKFHRIWPESDEIRFLQGLLGCWSQGLAFPRDLNIFYDRFSESMSQPYTRSQLSEKLRRLRKKYRTMAGRIARGQDPSRLSQHDRDLLHLSTRLWDPANSSSSPFSVTPDIVPSSGTNPAGNKRRRPNSRARSSGSPTQVVVALESAAFVQQPKALLALPSTSAPDICMKGDIDPIAPVTRNGFVDDVTINGDSPTIDDLGVKMGVGNLTVKSVLNVFDGVLNEVRGTFTDQGIISFDGFSDLGSEMKMMSKKIQEQRLAELDLLARRWRLLIEEKSNQEEI